MTEEQDKGFREGYLVAKYLELYPCHHAPQTCAVCIDTAVNFVRSDIAKKTAIIVQAFSERDPSV